MQLAFLLSSAMLALSTKVEISLSFSLAITALYFSNKPRMWNLECELWNVNSGMWTRCTQIVHNDCMFLCVQLMSLEEEIMFASKEGLLSPDDLLTGGGMNLVAA